MNGIEKHLNSCDFHLGYKKPSDGHLYYTDIRSADLIAQASHQLATKFHLRKNVGSKIYAECVRFFEYLRANDTY